MPGPGLRRASSANLVVGPNELSKETGARGTTMPLVNKGIAIPTSTLSHPVFGASFPYLRGSICDS